MHRTVWFVNMDISKSPDTKTCQCKPVILNNRDIYLWECFGKEQSYKDDNQNNF